jgi:geranylgeranyl diphosphate synthase type II
MLQEKEVQVIINQSINNLNYPLEPDGLYEPIKYILSLGGKRLRPVFALLACNLFSEEVSLAIEPAIGLEIFHNFTLLHDDIMDKAKIRRGHATVHCKWCDNVAILSGDAMQIDAYRHIGQAPERQLKKILNLFSQTAMEVCEGQQYDMDFERRNDVSLVEYIEMIRLKTAVLLACSLKIGAWIGGADEVDAQLLYDFGINLGLAFQLQDDLLDVYGDADKFGKNIGGDILCNKKTFLLISALRRAEGAVKVELEYWLTAEESSSIDKIAAVTQIYNKLNVKKLCQKEMDGYYHKALAALNALRCAGSSTKEIRNFSNKLMHRES